MGIGALVVATTPAALRPRPTLVRRRIPVMGTVAEVAIPTRNEVWAQRAIDAAFAELRRIDQSMSRFRRESEVGRLNAAEGAWTAVSADTATVLAHALRWAESTRGRFDPCLERMSRVWDVSRREVPPEDDALRPFAGVDLWRALEVEATHVDARARLTSSLAGVDLGGIGKGFAVDVAGEALRSFGVVDGLVNVGGDLLAMGADPGGDPWVVGVRAADDPGRLADELHVTDGAIATSGDYLRFFEHRGTRYHHLLDTTSGRPHRTPMRSITVTARRCIDADAAATGFFGVSALEMRRAIRSVPVAVRVAHHITEVTT